MEIKLKSSVKQQKPSQFFRNPMRVIAVSFVLLILLGTLLLMLPVSAVSGKATPFLLSLFTATSSTCITGMYLLDLNQHWSMFGQVIIITLIQLGGLGLVTITTFFNIALRKKMGFSTMNLARESVSLENPAHIKALLRLIMGATLLLELLGALLLSIAFVPQYGWLKGGYYSLFTSISAYCNAGVVIFGSEKGAQELMHLASSPLVLLVIMVLALIGGLGFVVWHDLYLYRRTKHLLLHTKLVVTVTLVLLVGGAIIFLSTEWNNPRTLGSLSPAGKIVNSLFFSTACRTSGFENFPVEGLSDMSRMFAVLLMFIGAAPGSTGGGVKLTTFAVLIMTSLCVVRGRDETMIMGRRIDRYTVYKALTIVMLAFTACIACTCILTFTSHGGRNISFSDALFETISAFSTTGFSLGIIEMANPISKVLLSVMMFVGRLGPVTFAFSFAVRPSAGSKNHVLPEGKIMVG